MLAEDVAAVCFPFFKSLFLKLHGWNFATVPESQLKGALEQFYDAGGVRVSYPEGVCTYHGVGVFYPNSFSNVEYPDRNRTSYGDQFSYDD